MNNFNKKINFWFAVLFGAIGLIASDTFIPSISSIAKDFNTSVSTIQSSVALFMFGFCLARFGISILSDGFGRKPLFILCFFLLFLGSDICLFSLNAGFFLVGRLLQGIGAGGSNVLARVIIRDVVENEELAKYNALYSMFAVTLMVMAPFIGSLLQTYFNWHAAFILIALLGAIAWLLSSLVYRETNHYRKLANIKLTIIKSNFLRLVGAPNGIKYAVLLWSCFGFMTAWLTSGSVILQEKMHFTYMEFGYCALLVGFFYFMASLLSSRYVGQYGERYFIVLGMKLFILPPVLLTATFLLNDTFISSLMIVLSVAIGFLGAGFIIPNAYSLGVKSFLDIAGMAGAFFGFAQMFGGFVYSSIISCSNSYSLTPLLLMMMMTFIIMRLNNFSSSPDLSGFYQPKILKVEK